MAMTKLSDVQEQIQKFWSPVFAKKLKEDTLLPSLLNRDYSGEIRRGGDTVYVSALSYPTGQTRSMGVDSESFDSEKMQTTRIAIQANKRLVASFKAEDLLDIQSQLDQNNPEIRRVLEHAIMKQLNNLCYGVVSPSSSNPDHILSGVGTMDASQLLSVRALASQAKWDKMKGWFLMLDASYMNDILAAQTLTSKEYIGDETPVVGGQVVNRRFGFNILEDNSEGLLSLSPANASAEVGLAFHPDFAHLVMGEPRFKVSDLHAKNEFGYVVSVDVWAGVALGIEGGLKCISIYNT